MEETVDQDMNQDLDEEFEIQEEESKGKNLLFQKYGSIENLSTKKFLESVYSYFPDIANVEFVVLEKAHGAHFSFQHDGLTITCAKRSAIIPDNENFYDHKKILVLYATRINELRDKLIRLLNVDPDLVGTVQIEGELIGGDYPHEDVEQFQIAKVQKGVFYCPFYEFFAYDIRYYDKAKNRWKFLNYDNCMQLFKECKFHYAVPLARGQFKQVVNYNIEFNSTIPALFGLPEIKDNLVEGVVLKPVESLHFPNGSRVIFKNKNARFSETYESFAKKAKSKQKTIVIDETPSDIKELQDKLMLYVTPNRLANVISKIGKVTFKDVGKLTGLLSRDAIEDFEKDNDGLLAAMDKEKKKLVTKKLAIQCGNVVRNYFIDP